MILVSCIRNNIIKNPNQLDKAISISNLYKEDHDSGFLYKKTVYDKY